MDQENEDFMRFYKAYPRKVSPGQALRTWIKLEKNKQLPSIDVIIEALKNQDKERKRLGKTEKTFIQHPSTWLNALGWLNEVSDENCERDIKKTAADRAREAADALTLGLSTESHHSDDVTIVATINRAE